jgi:hypothetical protein
MQSDSGTRTRTEGRLEILIQPPDDDPWVTRGGIRSPLPRKPVLYEVVDWLESLSYFIESVYRAAVIKDAERAGLGEPDQWTPEVVETLEARFNRIPTYIRVSRIHMASPLEIVLELTRSVGDLGIPGVIVYLFHNADKIAEWYPTIRTRWYEGQLDAEKAKEELRRFREGGGNMRELE